MRNAEETLSLFKQVLQQRRGYVRSKVKAAKEALANGKPKQGRPQSGLESELALRGGMLSELSTIECVLKMIEQGDKEPLYYWSEWSVPKASESTEIA